MSEKQVALTDGHQTKYGEAVKPNPPIIKISPEHVYYYRTAHHNRNRWAYVRRDIRGTIFRRIFKTLFGQRRTCKTDGVSSKEDAAQQQKWKSN
ncbi:unnamed protein product [Caenorhabditis bovis]|uniref:Uncharacterized protein n=1 Tax=Caenorhabditis bovis TaxID=2654633 RepID=A0A8S1EKN3_9PELO|nr:unnamed protein product [Caenorhabditis bovis]